MELLEMEVHAKERYCKEQLLALENEYKKKILALEKVADEKLIAMEKKYQQQMENIKKEEKPLRHIMIDREDIQFCFIISSYNNSKNICKNIESVLNQTYKKWRAIYINDNSTDDTEEQFFGIMERESAMREKFTYIKNNERMRQMHNKYNAYSMVKDFEIVCILDGDDWLYHENVLQILYSYYSTIDAKVITSNYRIFQDNKITNEKPMFRYYSEEELLKNTVRYNDKWHLKHLKTGYGILFKSIPKKYVQYNNEWLYMCTDWGEMFSVCELSDGNVKQVNEYLYVYNRENSLLYETSYYNNKNCEQRKGIEHYLRTLPVCKYSFPFLYIIHMAKDYKKKIQMLKQMQLMGHTEYVFWEAVDGSVDPSTADLYKKYVEEWYKSSDNLLKGYNVRLYYNMSRQHITRSSLGLLQSVFSLLKQFVEDENTEDHIMICEDDIYSIKDIRYYLFINPLLLNNKDLIYLGCHHNKNKLYHISAVCNHDAFLSVNHLDYQIYGTYAMIISKRLASYILSFGLEKIIRLNLSWDLFLNFVRETEKSFCFYVYYKQLIVPEVRNADSINGIRDMSFYTERDIRLEDYHL